MDTALQEVLGAVAAGVAVLTTPGPGGHGTTTNTVTPVSTDPPLVLACVARSSRIAAAVDHAGMLGVSILAADQTAAAHWFADPRRPSGARQFDVVDHTLGARTRSPLITGALGWLECRLVTSYDGGDHLIVVAEVLVATTGADEGALVRHRGGLGRHDPTSPLLRAA